MSNPDININLPVTAIIKQPNVITEASYDMSAFEKNILYILISKLKNNDPEDKIYEIHINELEEMTNNKINYAYLRDSTENLIKRLYTIYEKDTNKIYQLAPLMVAKYKKKSGTLFLRFSEIIRGYFLDLIDNYTLFQFETAMRLKSKYSKRIYEMLCQYKSSGWFKISVRELKERFKLIDPETGKERYEKFAVFANNVLKPALKEINESTEINFKYTPELTGHKITKILFEIEKIKGKWPQEAPEMIATSTQEAPQPSPLEKRLHKKCEIYPDLAKKVVKKLPAEKIEWVIKCILKKHEAGEIESIGGYSTTIFKGWLNGAEPTFEKSDSPRKYISPESVNQVYQSVPLQNEIREKLSNEFGLGHKKAYGLVVTYGGELEKLEAAIRKVEESIERKEIERSPAAIFKVLTRGLNGQMNYQPSLVRLDERSNSVNTIESLVHAALPSPKIQVESAGKEKERREKTAIWEVLVFQFAMLDEEADALVEKNSVESLRLAINKVEEALKDQEIPQEPTQMREELKKQLKLV
jgi:hypothetical protein